MFARLCNWSFKVSAFTMDVKNRETQTSFIEELLILNAVFRANCRRIDLSAVQGQSSRLSVILRGTQSSRLVQCFSSHPEELQVSSKI